MGQSIRLMILVLCIQSAYCSNSTQKLLEISLLEDAEMTLNLIETMKEDIERTIKQEGESTKEKLNKTKQELAKMTLNHIETMKEDIEMTIKQEGESTKEELNKTKQELELTKQEVIKTQNELAKTKEDMTTLLNKILLLVMKPTNCQETKSDYPSSGLSTIAIGSPPTPSVIKLVKPTSCQETKLDYPSSGLAEIAIDSLSAPLTVYCDQDTAGGGWLVIMRRISDTVRFHDRLWEDYKLGFGDLETNFWLGLENMHQLTYGKSMILCIELEDWEGNSRYAEYTFFQILGEDDGYRLRIGKYSGDAGDSLTRHNGQKFSTQDRDNDAWTGGHCAQEREGAWWYDDCTDSALTGEYLRGRHKNAWHGIYWRRWKGDNYSYKVAAMKVRAAA